MEELSFNNRTSEIRMLICYVYNATPNANYRFPFLQKYMLKNILNLKHLTYFSLAG